MITEDDELRKTDENFKRLVTLAQPQPSWLVLVVAVSGGGVAARIAPHVHRVIVGELALHQPETAASYANYPNVNCVTVNAANLAFADHTFDLVICDNTAQHVPDCFCFIQECARVVKSGGALLIHDQLAPEAERAARYVNAFERLRNPDSRRILAEYEWRGMFLDAGLSVETVEILSRPVGGLVSWAAEQNCAPEIIEKLQVMLVQAPQAVAEFWHPRLAGTPDADCDRTYILILGKKI